MTKVVGLVLPEGPVPSLSSADDCRAKILPMHVTSNGKSAFFFCPRGVGRVWCWLPHVVLAKLPAANFARVVPVSAPPNSPHAVNPPSRPKRGVWVPEVARAEAEHYFGGLGMDDWYFRHYTPAGQGLCLPSTREPWSLLRSFVCASSLLSSFKKKAFSDRRFDFISKYPFIPEKGSQGTISIMNLRHLISKHHRNHAHTPFEIGFSHGHPTLGPTATARGRLRWPSTSTAHSPFPGSRIPRAMLRCEGRLIATGCL